MENGRMMFLHAVVIGVILYLIMTFGQNPVIGAFYWRLWS